MSANPFPALFRAASEDVTDPNVCRGCGRIYEDSATFIITHEATCRHVRMFNGLRTLYVIAIEALPNVPTVAPWGSLGRLINEQIADIVCAVLGPCDDLYITGAGEHVRCDMQPNHGANHQGTARKGGRFVWLPVIGRYENKET